MDIIVIFSLFLFSVNAFAFSGSSCFGSGVELSRCEKNNNTIKKTQTEIQNSLHVLSDPSYCKKSASEKPLYKRNMTVNGSNTLTDGNGMDKATLWLLQRNYEKNKNDHQKLLAMTQSIFQPEKINDVKTFVELHEAIKNNDYEHVIELADAMQKHDLAVEIKHFGQLRSQLIQRLLIQAWNNKKNWN